MFCLFRAKSRVTDTARKREMRKKKSDSAVGTTDTSEGILFVFLVKVRLCVCVGPSVRLLSLFSFMSNWCIIGLFWFNFKDELLLNTV